MAYHSGGLQLLLPYPSDMPLVPVSRHRLMARWIVVSFVQAQMLNPGSRTFHHYASQGHVQQFGVVNVGSGHHQAQWPSTSVNQDTPLAARLAPVRGIAAY